MLSDHVDPVTSHLHTDASQAYTKLGLSFVSHGVVNHTAGEYVRGNVSTNVAESFFSQFKRSLDGTHHNVSKEHLHHYTTEFEFRWNTRKLTDAERVQKLINKSAGKR